MNENRSVFALDGITGMLIATVLLLSILAGLTVLGLGAQSANGANFYEVKNEMQIGSGIMGQNVPNEADHMTTVK